MLKALIVDDEAKARRILENLIQENFPDITLLESAANVPEALRMIHQQQPQLVFLDIEMPGYTGFQLLELIGKPNFEIIFTTAYADYALQAFEVSAVDYLLKPIRIQKLQQAVEKAIKRITTSGTTGENIAALQQNLQANNLQRLAVPVADGLLFVNVDDLLLLEAEGAYTRLHLFNQPPLLISKMMKDFEAVLEQHPDFFRCHRSFLINMKHVIKYSRADGGSIVMRNEKEVLLARDKKEAFLRRIEEYKI
ncbi:MAG: LytR/AlgR family response regulator transcription factor [Lacibacter sp.]|jgi:two-component system LytT family response regulator